MEKKGKKSKNKIITQSKEKEKSKTKDNVKTKNKDIKINNNINNIKKEINNKNNNDNLSLSSNNDKGNFNQVLFDYKNFNGNNGPIKRRKDVDMDEEEIKEIKNQIDLVNKQKRKGWIQKEEIINEKPKKEIKLESYVNDNIKDNNKELNNSEISLLSLGKINEEIIQEENKKKNKKNFDILKNKISEKKGENTNVSKNKNNLKSLDKINSLDDLLLLDKIIDNNSINTYNNLNNISSINNLNKISQEGFDVDFNSNVQSKDKSYNFNNGLVLINNNINNNNNVPRINQKKENEINEENKNQISKYQEYLKFKKLSNSKNKNNINEQIKNNKIEEKNHKNNININDYELEIKTQEDQQTYDEFYKMNHNNRKSVGNTHNNKRNNKNNIINNIPENSRLKKEREKMKGHKCELCQKFYDCINEEDTNFLCQECSRHRTNAPINKTPQGFYDLSI